MKRWDYEPVMRVQPLTEHDFTEVHLRVLEAPPGTRKVAP
ncbi:hypothetical protein SCHAM137S_02194 [Streptomyces chartreusis]|nr:hypothetical protein SAMN05216482_9127 [Streptomyces sp. PAN_FS17]